MRRIGVFWFPRERELILVTDVDNMFLQSLNPVPEVKERKGSMFSYSSRKLATNMWCCSQGFYLACCATTLWFALANAIGNRKKDIKIVFLCIAEVCDDSVRQGLGERSNPVNSGNSQSHSPQMEKV